MPLRADQDATKRALEEGACSPVSEVDRTCISIEKVRKIPAWWFVRKSWLKVFIGISKPDKKVKMVAQKAIGICLCNRLDITRIQG